MRNGFDNDLAGKVWVLNVAKCENSCSGTIADRARRKTAMGPGNDWEAKAKRQGYMLAVVLVLAVLLLVILFDWMTQPSKEEQEIHEQAVAAERWLSGSDDPAAREYRAREAARQAIEQEKQFQQWRDAETRRKAILNER
jgi:type II secretory pathway component PulM